MQIYRCALLTPHRVPDAEICNAALLGPRTLGIEVTEPDLARRCGLGNVDPQHSGGGTTDQAAIETCLRMPLPPAGSLLVTLRPDLDALGGMAVLDLRAMEIRIDESAFGRIGAIAARDRFARGPWPGPRPLTLEVPFDADRRGACLAIQAASAVAADHSMPLQQRVRAIAAWLADGSLPGELLACGERNASHARAIAMALGDGRLRVDSVADGRIACVRSRGTTGCLELGYRIAPVIVACDNAFRFQGGLLHRKFTVCQFAPGHADLRRAAGLLRALECGWGGSPTIIGSPQGVGSKLEVEEVVAVVTACLSPVKAGMTIFA